MPGDKRVVHFVHLSASFGGIEVLLPVVINAMTDCNFKAFVLRRPKSNEHNIYNHLNIPVSIGHNNNIKAIQKLAVYAFKNRHDIFHCYNIGPVFLFIIRFSGVKNLIYSIHGTVYWKAKWKKPFLKGLWYLTLTKRVIITANSEYSKNVFLREVNSNINIRVAYNPIDYKRFSPRLNYRSDESIKIVYTGRLSKGKNLEKWIEIASELSKLLRGARFEIYGSGPIYKLLQDKISHLGAQDYISLRGFRVDVENVYREADLMLFLSEYESFGNVAVESIFCGTPVLVSDIHSMQEIFRDFPEFIIDPDANLINTLYDNILNINYLRKRALLARESFIRRFSVEAHVEHLDEIYQSFRA